MEEIRVDKPKKAYQRIVEAILDLIVQGKLEYGDRLYSEQELLTMLGVSRPTLREALRVLEFLGIAEVSPRRGISISRPDDSGGYLPLSCVLLFEKTTDRELSEIRRALQVEMAGQAARRGRSGELDALRDIVRRSEESMGAAAEIFAGLDYDFHQQIVVCSHNRLALKLSHTLSALLRRQLGEVIAAMPVEGRRQTLACHREILGHIQDGNGAAASEAMHRHLQRSYDTMTDRPIRPVPGSTK